VTQVDDKILGFVRRCTQLRGLMVDGNRLASEATSLIAAHHRTPSPPSPTRSDTREQAAASPSAVGEGLLQELVRAWDTGDFVCDEHFAMLINRARSFAAKAPKTASAGGEPDWRHIANEYADAAANGIQWIRNIEKGCSTSETAIAEMQANMKRIRAIAAEADTAKDLPWNHPDWPEFVATMPGTPPDRLAPIEARGAVNPFFWIDAIRTALHTTDCDDKRRVLTNAANALENFLRARESAPAVEPSVSAGCDGEANTTKPSIVDVELTEDFLTAASHAFWGAYHKAHRDNGRCFGGTQAGLAAVAKLALSLSPAAPPPAETILWFPIETAPKDGSYVLLRGPTGYTTFPFRVRVCRYDAKLSPRQPWVDYANDSFLDDGPAPTHWARVNLG
jgi:hypothetical protein